MAKKKKDATTIITLQCKKCNRLNYTSTKNRRNIPGRMELKKFCKHDREHTLHKETKK